MEEHRDGSLSFLLSSVIIPVEREIVRIIFIRQVETVEGIKAIKLCFLKELTVEIVFTVVLEWLLDVN